MILRPWLDQDASVKATWGTDPEIVQWTDLPANYTEEGARAWAARVEESRLAGRAVALAIVEATSGEVVGSCDIRRPDLEDEGLGEVGYLLAAKGRGRGLATHAVALLIHWGFNALGLERIQALTHPDNPSSARVLERVGFQREGLLRSYRAGDSGREDRILYSVLRGDR